MLYAINWEKIPKNGYIIFFDLNDFQVFSDFYKAYNFVVGLNDFVDGW